MEMTLGKRIAMFRKEKGLKQEELADLVNLSPQAISKWENNQTCPDISLLPELARIIGVTVDELLSGKQEPTVQVLPTEERKDIKDLMLRVVVDSVKGDKVRINLPMSLMQVALDTGMEMPQVQGNEMLKNIDFKQLMELVEQGVVGNLVEVDSANGDKVRIFVE